MPVPPTDPLKDYLTALEPAIRTSLCLQPFPSQYVERHDRPVIECEPESSHLRSAPITIRRSGQEACLIEPSINSTRISFRFKTADSLERYILDSYRRFMLRRAEDLEILRRIAVHDYDVTFLITYGHLTRYSADGLTAFIIQFVAEFCAELSSTKLILKRRSRSAAQSFWATFEQSCVAGEAEGERSRKSPASHVKEVDVIRHSPVQRAVIEWLLLLATLERTKLGAMAAKRTSLEAQILAVCNAHAEGISDAALTEKLKDSCSVEARADALNKLLTDYRIQVFKSADGEHLIYKAVSAQDAIKRKGLGSEDQLVLQCISSAGNVGVWTRDMKNRTHLPQTKINRILKVLEERGLVKHVKSMQNASKKVYILAELEPAKEITGGPWYGPDSFDLEFIKVLQKASRKHIKDSGQANLHDILDFIVSSVRCNENLSHQPLQVEDIKHIVETLEYDGDVERIDVDGEDHYRPARSRIPEWTPAAFVPCGVCPVIDECVEGGKISPQTCIYYTDWLE